MKAPGRAVLLPLLGGILAAASGCGRSDPLLLGVAYAGQQPAADLALSTLGASRQQDIRLAHAWDFPSVDGAAGEVDRATKLAALGGILGVVGHGGSREALMTAPIYNEAGIPQLLPTATSRRLETAGPWTFMLAPNDSIEGEFIGGFVAGHLGARTVTLFYVLDEYGAGLRDGVTAALSRRGVRVLDMVPVESGVRCGDTPSMMPSIDAALRRGVPDVFVLALRQHEGACVVGHIASRIGPSVFVAGDGLLDDAVMRRQAERAAALYVAAFWHADRDDPRSREFVRRFSEQFGRAPRPDEAMVYDALSALIVAARGAGHRPGQVRDYLASLGRTRAPLPGVTGPIAFPAGPDRLLMTRWHRGGQDVVKFQ